MPKAASIRWHEKCLSPSLPFCALAAFFKSMPLPLSTYRIQLQPSFGFDAVAELAGYLSELGVTHLYASPYLQAAPGSTHGYDVLDHRQPNEELGGFAGHERMCAALGQANLGQVLDIVPNHMSIASRGNRWWWDVLENGQASVYASYFDVDWQPPEERLRNLVLLPVLGEHFGRVLDERQIQLVRDGGSFNFQYFDHVFPLAPRSQNDLLMAAAQKIGSDELAFLADAFASLPLSTTTDRRRVLLRHRDKEVLRRLLDRLCREQPAAARAIDETIADLNADPLALAALLDRQNYRLAFWRTAGEELVYRRFFDINTLASLRMEEAHVFEDTHELVLNWLEQCVIDGLRIDHPDGLRDPEGYFHRIRQRSPNCWLVVEKILESGEWLPSTWPVHGTTGYDFLNRLTGILVEPQAETALTSFYHEFTGQAESYEEIVHRSKQQVLRESFSTDVFRLSSLLQQICERHTRFRDYTRREVHAAVREVVACFPVYRSYARAESGVLSENDAKYVEHAISAAQAQRPDLDSELFKFVRELLLLRVPGELENQFVMRFQQMTGPVMAKGVEDTAFYNFNRLAALNEVGGDPGRFGLSLQQFHWNCLETQKTWPHSMLTTTTHDTKRSEDVRARICVLSEFTGEWTAAVKKWAERNERHKAGGLPDRNFEYLFYQTLVGAWPLSADRALAYAEKAIREAKAHTTWLQPQPEYESAVAGFVRACLEDSSFTQQVEAFVEPIAAAGRVLSLAQVLVKLTTPGVPDIYQGNELWDLSLVDPDNRRPVDFASRRRLLQELSSLSVAEIVARSNEGLPKLWLTTKTLKLRREHPEWFGAEGDYSPIWVAGVGAQQAIAYQRGAGCIVVAPLRGRRTDWGDSTIHLPAGTWRHVLTGEAFESQTLPLNSLWRSFPVALLTRT
jgi:(1->4)-alpha-D-glucan 1-alpha-D-glucosylmutase